MSDLTDDLKAAVESVSEPEVTETTAPAPLPEPKPEVELETPAEDTGTAEERARARDEKGRFAKAAEEKAAAEKAAAEPIKPVEVKPAARVEAPAAKPGPDPDKAPVSWRAMAREQWSQLPAELRDEVVRREKEVNIALQESKTAREGYQRYTETVQPFEQMIRAEGGEPVQAIQGLLQTAYALRMAPPQTKAQMIARMVQSFLPGREGLELLDAALTPGAQQQGQQAPRQPQEFRDPRVDQILQAQSQQAEQRARAQVEEVQAEEFYEDVRLDMADILELDRKRGGDMSLRDAYNRAIRLNPDVSRVVEQREAAARATPGGATQRKAAAVSVRSTPAAPPSGSQEQSLRDTIAAQLER